MFAVVRHPDVDSLGIVAEAALEHQRAQGWFRVSDYREQPSDFHLPDFADATDDLDAAPDTQPDEPAGPADDEPEPQADEAATTEETKA